MKKQIIYSFLALGAAFATFASFDTPLSPKAEETTEGIEPPYFLAISSNKEFKTLKAEDANNDGFTWYRLGDCAHNRYNWQDKTIPADDYLYTPGIRLEKNAKYTFEADLNNGTSTTVARVGFVVATAQEHTAVVDTIMKPRLFTKPSAVWEHCSADFIAPEDGVYYFGVWDCSDANGYGPSVKNLSVSAPVFMEGPAEVTDLMVTPDQEGKLFAKITYKAPELSMTGKPLQELTKVEIYRDDQLVATQNPQIGEAMVYNDTVKTNGKYNYRLTTYNSVGVGNSAEVTAFVGFDWPGDPTDIHTKRGENNGELIISWEAPENDQNGLPMPEGTVTYDVYRIVDKSPKLIAENYDKTEITDQAVIPDGRNSIVQYQIISKYNGKGGNFDCTGIITVGSPYTLPFKESVEQGKTTWNWRTYQDLESGSRWYAANDSRIEGCQSQDNDNGYFLFNGTAYGKGASTIISSAISLKECDDPILSFYVFKVANATTNGLKVWIRECEDPEAEFVLFKEMSMGEGYNLNWNRHEYSLADYVGKEIQIAFEGICDNYLYGMLDNIRVENAVAVNLKAEVLSAPGKVFGGTSFELTVHYKNEGKEDSGNFTIQLYRDKNLVDEKTVESVAAKSKGSLSFVQKTPVIYTGESKYRAVIVCEADADDSDNTTNEVVVKFEEPSHPSPEDLSAESREEDIHLSWSEPKAAEEGTATTELLEDFETYASFSRNEAGMWKFHDLDGAGTGAIQGLELPGQNLGEPSTWMVFDKNAIPGFNPNSFEMPSGSKCLAVLYNYRGEQNDDWVVSPRLSGNEQSMSFFAMNLSNLGDKIEVMVSTTDNNPSSFTKLYEITDFLPRWRKYTMTLPEGTAYFALRYCSANASAIFVDDINYQPYTGALESEVSGYNVYRNGEILNETPVKECNYVDEAPGEGVYMYHVTAVYGDNESTPCDYVIINHSPSGVETALNNDAKIKVSGNQIIITAGENDSVVVYDLSGRMLKSGSGSMTLTLPEATYVVRLNETTIKVIL